MTIPAILGIIAAIASVALIVADHNKSLDKIIAGFISNLGLDGDPVGRVVSRAKGFATLLLLGIILSSILYYF